MIDDPDDWNNPLGDEFQDWLVDCRARKIFLHLTNPTKFTGY